MIRVKKCRSKKHESGGGGCGNPRCPEGRSIKAAQDAAIANNDTSRFISVRQLEESRNSFNLMREWIRESFFSSPVKPVEVKKNAGDRQLEDVQRIKDIDKNHFPSFTEIGDLNNYLNQLYRPDASLTLFPLFDISDSGLKALVVQEMEVKEGLRGFGVGRHMRAVIKKFGDENNYAVMGIPASTGDGTVPLEDPNFKAHALAHRKRLEKFYTDSGYEYNYAFKPESLLDPLYWEKDELTGEPYPSNPEWKNQFNSAAQEMLEEGGFFVRWPNNQIPQEWKA